jgi:adenylate cyclase class 2
MADKNMEIEIRFILTKGQYQHLLSSLPRITAVQGRKKQKDTYFSPPHKNFLQGPSVSDWLRIGERGDRVILNFKHWYYAKVPSQGGTHCDEFEVEVKDAPALYNIFQALQFKQLCIVQKERSTFLYKKTFEIALDQVNGLGYFIEIETKKAFPTVQKAREQLFRFAQTLGIDIERIETKGYPWLLLQKKKLLPSSSPS